MSIDTRARSWVILLCGLAACTSPPDGTSEGGAAGGGEAGAMAGLGGMASPDSIAGTGGMAGIAGMGGMSSLGGTGGVAAPVSQCERLPEEPDWLQCGLTGQAACAPSECRFEEVCYPNESSTEDGCCHCSSGVMLCLDSPSCPSSQLIGKRCGTEEDCSFPGARSGLQCLEPLEVLDIRSDAPGRVCTRPCGVGCPTGSFCFGQRQDADGGAAEGGWCLRRCPRVEVCDGTLAVPLNSECTATGFGPMELAWFCL